MGKSQSLFRGTILLTLANIGLRGSGVCFQVFLSNQIGAAGIGLLQLILSVSVFAATLGSGGVRVAAMYLTAQEQGAGRPQGARQALGCCLIFGALLSALVGGILAISAHWIAQNWIGDLQAVASLRLLGILLPMTCLWSVMASYFTATSRLGTLVWVQFLDQAIHIAVTMALLGLWAKGDTGRACQSLVAGNGVATLVTLILFFFLIRGDSKAGEGTSKMWRRLLRLCIPLGLNDTLRSGLSTVENMIIPKGLAKSGVTCNQALASYGTIMGMVFPILMFPAVIFMSLGDLLVPELAKWKARNNQQRISQLCDKCLRMGMVFSLTVAGIYWSSAENIGELLYHNPEVGSYLRIFAPMILVLYLDSMVDGMHKGLGEQVYCVRINTLTNLLDVIFLWIFLPIFGIGGYILTFTLTHVLNFYLSLIRLTAVAGYTMPMGFFGKALFCGALATGVATVAGGNMTTNGLSILSAVMTFVVVFTSLLLLTSTFSAKDLAWMKQLLQTQKK